MPVPGIEPGLPTMSLLKYKKFCALDLNSVRHFATEPSELDNNNKHKAVLGKIPSTGTNLGSSEWN